MALKSAFLSSILRILNASSRDILTFIVVALTAALCRASVWNRASGSKRGQGGTHNKQMGIHKRQGHGFTQLEFRIQGRTHLSSPVCRRPRGLCPRWERRPWRRERLPAKSEAPAHGRDTYTSIAERQNRQLMGTKRGWLRSATR
jgi:hypothetical protein